MSNKQFYTRIAAVLIAAIILFGLIRGCTNSLKELRQSSEKPKDSVRVEKITKWLTRDSLIFLPGIPYTKYKDTIIYRDTGSVVIIKDDAAYVPDSLIDDIVNDYLAERYYEKKISGKGWKAVKRDTVFQNNLMGTGLTVEVEHQTITRTIQKPPRREGFIGMAGGLMDGRSLYYGPELSYKDKRGRLFRAAVIQGPEGTIYQAGIGFKLSFTKKL